MPGGELLGAGDADADLLLVAGDLVLARAIQLEHEAHDIRLVLREPEVRDASTRNLVVHVRRHVEACAGNIEHHAIRAGQDEVLDVDGTAQGHDYFSPSSGRHDADGGD